MDIVRELQYYDISKLFSYSSFSEELEELDKQEKIIIKILFKFPSFVLLNGINALKQYEETFSLNLNYGDYNEDEIRDIKVSSILDSEELYQFEYIFDADIDEYGFINDFFSEEELTTQINDSTFRLKLKQKNICISPPELKLSGKFTGSCSNISISDQFKCMAKIIITGLSKDDYLKLPAWKNKMILAFIDYKTNNYDGMIKNVHTCFEVFLKTQTRETLKFNQLWSKVMLEKGLAEIDLLMKTAQWNKTKGKSDSDKIYRKQIELYQATKSKRNANTHERHIPVSKKEAEKFAYICITFIYSILLKENKFMFPWIQGLE